MKCEITSELVLENTQRDENRLTIFPDQSAIDLVGFKISDKSEPILLCNDKSDISANYFHLDKFSVGCLIDYLKRIHDEMD